MLQVFLTGSESNGTFRDIFPFWMQWAVMAVLETVWLLVTYLLHSEGCPAGYLGPGGLHENGKYWNCTGGAAGLIDRAIFGESHIFQHVTSREVYFHDEFYFGGYIRKFDPCGILGSINSILIVFLGLQVGKIFERFKDEKSRAIRMALWSGMLTVVGGALTGVQQFDGPMPLNKNLWTLSFVLICAGWGFFVFLILHFTIDIKEFRLVFRPFYYLGRNAILIYLLTGILPSQVPFCGTDCTNLTTHAQYLWSQIGAVVCWALYATYLYYNDFFLTI